VIDRGTEETAVEREKSRQLEVAEDEALVD
jgi:hypothetical protein